MKRPDAPSLREALAAVRRELEAAGVESPDVDAERLLARALDLERSRLALEGERRLSADAAARLAGLVSRRVAGEPLQHIEGTVEFRRLVLRADSRALIPRPETEQLLDLVAGRRRSDAVDGEVRTVPRPGAAPSPREGSCAALDVGTGSGAIALSLVLEGLADRVVAVDVSEAALAQARENREAAGVGEAQVELRLSGTDPFGALAAHERFDVLVSNPPYVRDEELEALPPEVREHEPRAALAGGPDGLALVRVIAERAPAHLRSGARLFLEIGAEQADAVEAIFEAAGTWTDVRRHADLAERDRFVTARRR